MEHNERFRAACGGSMRDYSDTPAKTFAARPEAFTDWVQARDEFGLFPYTKSMLSAPSPEMDLVC